MKRSALIVTALLVSGSAWAAPSGYSAYADTAPYGEIVSDAVHGSGPAVALQGPGHSAYAGILDYGEIIADNLDRPGTVVGQPGVGDTMGRTMHTARTHERAFAHPDLDQSVLSDIGYNF
jgi:hypothetical protein